MTGGTKPESGHRAAEKFTGFSERSVVLFACEGACAKVSGAGTPLFGPSEREREVRIVDSTIRSTSARTARHKSICDSLVLDQDEKRIRLASLPFRVEIQRLKRENERLKRENGGLTRENEVLRGELAGFDEEPLRLDHPDDDW